MDTTTTELTTEKLQQDLKALVQDAEALLKAGAGELSDCGKDARAKLTGAIDAARATCGRLEERARVQAKATDQVIREHPYESIGISFVVGLLLGVLINRR
jgi:ElaB/YqjD/DUF883 family membrane-anchored ribosome-binding protein